MAEWHGISAVNVEKMRDLNSNNEQQNNLCSNCSHTENCHAGALCWHYYTKEGGPVFCKCQFFIKDEFLERLKEVQDNA